MFFYLYSCFWFQLDVKEINGFVYSVSISDIMFLKIKVQYNIDLDVLVIFLLIFFCRV